MKRQWLSFLASIFILIISVPSAPAQYSWTYDTNNPLLTDGDRLLGPAVLYDSTHGKYDLWYTDGFQIKRGVSADGRTWTLTGASQNVTSLFSIHFCYSVEVVKVGSTYFLYAGCQSADYSTMFISLATSSDGNVWTKHPSSPVLVPGGAGSWEKFYVLYPKVVVKNGTFYMYYQGNDTAPEVGLATSADGANWARYGGNPVIRLSAMPQNITALAATGLALVDGTFTMIVNEAEGASSVTSNLATSSDGITWSFYAGNPILTTGSAGSWNYGWLGDGSLKYLNGTYWFWHSATDTRPYQGSQIFRMGLVTSGSGTQGDFWHQTGGPLATQDVRILTSNSQGTLFAGTWTAGEVYKTTNNGDNWTVCSALPDPNPVLGLTVDKHDHIFASVFLKGIARSTNNGATWQMKNNGLTNFTTRWNLTDKQGNLWVATEGGLFRSTNDGESWTKQHTAMCYHVWLDSTGAVMTQEGDGTGFDENGNSSNYVYRSTDGGATWSTTHILGKSFAGIHTDGSYFANTYSLSSIYRSTDMGETWTDLHCPVSWDGATAQMTFLPQGDIYFTKNGNGAGVIRTTNGGATWEVKNSGLTTLRVTCIYPHPNGYIFLGTGFAGVFRSTESYAPPQALSVSLPQVVAAAGGTVEIPVNVTNVSGHGILSYEFTLGFNSPDSILSFEPVPVTSGTLSGQNNWSVQLNTTAPSEIKVGAFGSLPLAGEGVLLKLKVKVAPGARAGQLSSIIITHFLFNAGDSTLALHNGEVSVVERVCGDADENGLVQAYDAALTLREAMGPMSSPPPPLTPLGRLNADINQDGIVQAYDAALILRHAIGLSMPESTSTCFGPGVAAGSLPALALSGKLLGIERGINHTAVLIQLDNAPANMQVYSYSFELTCSAAYGDTTSLTLPVLGQNYLATVNRLGDGHFKVGIINPYGVDVKAISLTLTARYAASLNQITFKEIFLNDAPNETVTLTNIIAAVEQPGAVKPQSYELVGAYPNPFNPLTRIVFQAPVSAQVHLEVYNAQGTKIKTLHDEPVSSGRHEIFWDGTNNSGQTVATGEYFCVMRAGSYIKTLRLLLLK